MPNIKWFASVVLGTAMVSALNAETRCPGNVDSLPLRFINHHQMIVSVSVNHSGPYDFLLDTGTQVTAVDLSLSNALHLETGGAGVVAGAGSRQAARYVQLDLLEAGTHAVPGQRALVYDLLKLHVQGILGEDFLERFDVLIDNAHKLLCLDSSGAMRADVRGPHTTLVTVSEAAAGVKVSNLVIVEARLSDATRPVRLMLDSGADGAILYNTADYLAPPRGDFLQGAGVAGKGIIFWTLPPQDLKIGSVKVAGVPFFSFSGTQNDARAKGFDGILTMSLFRRVFIAHADHFVVLEP